MFCNAFALRKIFWSSGSLGRIETRSTSSASQATVFKKKSWFPWKPRSAFEAKSLSPKAATRPAGACCASSGDGEGDGDAPGDADGEAAGEGEGDGLGDGPFTVTTAPSETGPVASLPSSDWIRPVKARSGSAHASGEVSTR